MYKVALVGNPNSGKSTLFNRLTLGNVHVGNWAGVTVEKSEGIYQDKMSIVDLPGIYSMKALSEEEKISRDYILQGNYDTLIDVVDATNIERNLFLTMELLTMGLHPIIALNMMDEAKRQGIEIDVDRLSSMLGVRVVPISAKCGDGIDALMQIVDDNIKNNVENRHTYTIYKSFDERNIYDKIRKIVDASIRLNRLKSTSLTEKIDRVVLNKYLALPIFALIMYLVFFISIESVGSLLVGLLDRLLKLTQNGVRAMMQDVAKWAVSLVVDGIIGGVGSVVTYLPEIALLFGMISMLEASGYMARVGVIMDGFMRTIGLSGKSFLPLMMGAGCSVPALVSTRVLPEGNEKHATIALIPLVPCSAKLSMMTFFVTKFFHGNALFALLAYLVVLFTMVFTAMLLRKGESDIFMMELPPYRMPNLKNVLHDMKMKSLSFLKKAGTIIFLTSIIMWVMMNFDYRFRLVRVDSSMLKFLGDSISWVFAPLGFGRWEYVVSLFAGIGAKESIISIITELGVDSASLSALGAFSFMMFNVLSSTCIAGMGVIIKELGSIKKGILVIARQYLIAYMVCFMIYQGGMLFLRSKAVFFSLIIITLSTLFAIKIAVGMSRRYNKQRKMQNN